MSTAVAVGAVLFVGAVPASAANIGTAPVASGTYTDSNGSAGYTNLRAICIVRGPATFQSGVSQTIYGRCQTSGVVGSVTTNNPEVSLVTSGGTITFDNDDGGSASVTEVAAGTAYSFTITKTTTHAPWNGQSYGTGFNTTSGRCGMKLVIGGVERQTGTSGGNAQTILCHYASGATYGNWPVDWFTGGSDLNATPDVQAPSSVSCSRVLTYDPNVPSAKFDAPAQVAGDHATDSWEWDFGDESTPSTKRRPTHVYPALSGQPEDGWIAEVTLTRSLDSPSTHTFTDGTTADKTQTCELRVDFFNPNDSEVTSEDTGNDDDECPTGLGWLNPLSIGKILRCLFIPTGSMGESWGDFAGVAESTYPLGPAIFIGTAFTDAMDGLREGIEDGEANPDAATEDCGVGTQEVSVPGVTTFELPNVRIPYSGACAEEDKPGFVQTAQDVTVNLSRVLFLFGFVIFIKRQFEKLTGGGSEEGTEA